MVNELLPPPLPAPWRIHRTGSHLGIKDAKGKFVTRKVVNSLTIPEYDQLLSNFNHIVECVNTAASKTSPAT